MADLERANWGLVGAGNIGGELFTQVTQPEVADRMGLAQFPDFVMRSSGVYAPGDDPHDLSAYEQVSEAEGERLQEQPPEVVFITLPSDDDSGRKALEITEWAAGEGSVVVTAEKGMLANHWAQAKKATDNFRLLGRSATVGGGNRLIDVAQIYTHDPKNIQEFHLALNGTLTYMLSEMSHGVPLGIAANAAKKLGYAEPEAKEPLDILRGEAEGDVTRKLGILFNALKLGEELDWRTLHFRITDDDLLQLTEEVKRRRVIVSIYPESVEPESGRLGGFDVLHDGWRLVGGFREIDKNPMFAEIGRFAGTANGGKIGLGPKNVDGAYPIGGGPGAGSEPTVNAMLDDSLVVRRSL